MLQPRATTKLSPAPADAGFSLVIILVLIGALALAAAIFVQVSRSQVRSAAAAVSTASLEALADGGVQLAILDIVAAQRDRTRNRRFQVDGTSVQCAPSAGTGLAISVQDEAGKIDINIAPEELLLALVRGLGIARADAVTAAVLDFKDPDDDRRSSGAETADYLAAGRASGPKNAPFQSWEELGQVLGMPPGGPELLRPYVTVYSGQATLDNSAAAPGLAEVLIRGLTTGNEASATGDSTRTLPPEFIGASARRAFSVRVEARDGHAAFAREAVIMMTPSAQRPYIVRRWMRAPDLRVDREEPVASLPPC